MLVIQNTEHFRVELPTILTIGTFDGVHLGHKKILSRLYELKEKTGLQTAVLTFEPHPRRVLFPGSGNLKLLTSIDEKLELLEKNNVDIAVVYPFTRQFSEIDSDFYVNHILCKSLKVKHLVVGYDHKFGKNRSGDFNTLKKLEGINKYTVEEISALDIDSISISSTKIRRALEDGDVETANSYLGHSYFLNARVIKGKQLGRTIGYPTANLAPIGEGKLIPKIGIYFVEIIIDAISYNGMLSIGFNPTTDKDTGIKIEVNLFDFNKDIYGKSLKLIFIKRLRDEKKFAGIDELKNALREDEINCRKLLKAADAL